MIPVVSAGFLFLGGILLIWPALIPSYIPNFMTYLGSIAAALGALILFLELARYYLPKIKAWFRFEHVGEDGEEDNKYDEKPQ